MQVNSKERSNGRSHHKDRRRALKLGGQVCVGLYRVSERCVGPKNYFKDSGMNISMSRTMSEFGFDYMILTAIGDDRKKIFRKYLTMEEWAMMVTGVAEVELRDESPFLEINCDQDD